MRAFVLPPTGPGHFVEWADEPTELLPLLYREIGVDCVDWFPLRSQLGQMTGWVDDAGLLSDTPSYNLRAIQLARACGYMTEALAGTVVLTGGVRPDGDMDGLSDELVALFDQYVDVAVVEEARA